MPLWHSKGDRFFYQVVDGVLMCRVNELGGWHKACGGLRGSDRLEASVEQGLYDRMPNRWSEEDEWRRWSEDMMEELGRKRRLSCRG